MSGVYNFCRLQYLYPYQRLQKRAIKTDPGPSHNSDPSPSHDSDPGPSHSSDPGPNNYDSEADLFALSPVEYDRMWEAYADQYKGLYNYEQSQDSSERSANLADEISSLKQQVLSLENENRILKEENELLKFKLNVLQFGKKSD